MRLASVSRGIVVTGTSSGSKGVEGGGGTDDINSNKLASLDSGEGGGGGVGNDSLSSSSSSIPGFFAGKNGATSSESDWRKFTLKPFDWLRY